MNVFFCHWAFNPQKIAAVTTCWLVCRRIATSKLIAQNPGLAWGQRRTINIWNENFNDFEFQLNNVCCVENFHYIPRNKRKKRLKWKIIFLSTSHVGPRVWLKQFPRIFIVARQKHNRFFLFQLLLNVERKKGLKRIFRRCQQFN